MTAAGRTKAAAAIAVCLGGLLITAASQAQESFQVTLDQDGATIGDMRPVSLQYRVQPLPDISPREVARRYQRLFEQADEPEVRIDALNRLANLQALASDNLQFSPDQEQAVYRQALGSYDEILGRGAFQGRLDELLYQMAKAHAFVGQGGQSIARLKQMAGLYPQSPLAQEARFRIAEAAFSAGQFREAERMYREVLGTELPAGRAEQSLNEKAQYMLGWAQYKRGAFAEAGASFLAVLDVQAAKTQAFSAIPAVSLEMIDDTFRILAIMAAKQGGARALDALLAGVGERGFVDLLYDRLVDYYASLGDVQRASRVADAFLETYPDHPSVPAFRAQNVDLYLMAGDERRAWQAREAYVEAYRTGDHFQSLSVPYRRHWQDFARLLADHCYHRAGTGSAPDQARQDYLKAADLYAALAERVDAPGELRRLAGDAALQGNDRDLANGYYLQAAYQSGTYQGAADAAWASLILSREALDNAGSGQVLGQESSAPDALGAYVAAADRFANSFPDDSRVASLHADVAGRLLKIQDFPTANRFAESAISRAGRDPATAYSAWLVSAQSLAAQSDHSAAENAWRHALTLTTQGRVPVSSEDQRLLTHQLATSIYRQGEVAEASNAIELAIAHYQRIESVAPASPVAVKGRFDAANALLRGERWQGAINELQRFRNDYPQDPLTAQISEKLVYAYQASEQPVRAADELERNGPGDWQTRLRAAELYHLAGAVAERNRLYRAYMASVGRASSAAEHVQQQRIRQRLIASGEAGERLREELVSLERDSAWHSADTLAWAAQSAMVLGRQAAEAFGAIPLAMPLERSLIAKQQAMERAKGYFLLVAGFSDGELSSEARYRRAELYRVMAADLMSSSRPAGLSELELMQYDMLLEEQAFPFEELAIELHEENHRQLADGHFDHWVQRSLDMLAELYPGRYARDPQWMSWEREPVRGEDDA